MALLECALCGSALYGRTASIPESIICYKAGIEDPVNPGNRIVGECWCPYHGCVLSPGGGIAISYKFVGGPYDGRQLALGVIHGDDFEEILTRGPGRGMVRHLYRRCSPFVVEGTAEQYDAYCTFKYVKSLGLVEKAPYPHEEFKEPYTVK